MLCQGLNSLKELDTAEESEKQAKLVVLTSNETSPSFAFDPSEPGSVRFLNPAIIDALLKDFDPLDAFQSSLDINSRISLVSTQRSVGFLLFPIYYLFCYTLSILLGIPSDLSQ